MSQSFQLSGLSNMSLHVTELKKVNSDSGLQTRGLCRSSRSPEALGCRLLSLDSLCSGSRLSFAETA